MALGARGAGLQLRKGERAHCTHTTLLRLLSRAARRVHACLGGCDRERGRAANSFRHRTPPYTALQYCPFWSASRFVNSAENAPSEPSEHPCACGALFGRRLVTRRRPESHRESEGSKRIQRRRRSSAAAAENAASERSSIACACAVSPAVTRVVDPGRRGAAGSVSCPVALPDSGAADAAETAAADSNPHACACAPLSSPPPQHAIQSESATKLPEFE